MFQTICVRRAIKNASVKGWVASYNSSWQNKLCLLNVFYSHDVMGKRKYTNVRKANKAPVFEGLKVPNFVTYNELSKFIREIDISILHNVNTLIPESDQIYEGSYREPASYIKC